jgi:hypothetical protein
VVHPAFQKGPPSCHAILLIVSRTYWAGDLRTGQVALFHFECKSRMMCSADGEFTASGPAVFDSMPDAEVYAQKYVQTNLRRGCRVYDSTGAIVGEYVSTVAMAEENPRGQAKRDLFIGLLGLLLMPLGLLFDHWVRWSMFLGMALATKFTMMGILKLSDGIAGLIQTKSR